MYLVEFKTKKRLRPCPFCGGAPEMMEIQGSDWLMRCSECHASAEKAGYGWDDAIKYWNSGKINDDHYPVQEDTPISDYLNEQIRGIRLRDIEGNQASPGCRCLCERAVVITEKGFLFVEANGNALRYDFTDYTELQKNHDLDIVQEYQPLLSDGKEPICLVRSSYQNKLLRLLVIRCGEEEWSVLPYRNWSQLEVKVTRQPLKN